MDEVDEDNDGCISYEEFLDIFRFKKRYQCRDACANICGSSKHANNDSGEQLLDEHTAIPGGRCDIRMARLMEHSEIDESIR